MQRNPPQIVKWHAGASMQLGHDMHWILLMCQCIRPLSGTFFAGPGYSQYTLKRSLILKRPHCTSCQDKIDQILIWTGAPSKKKKKKWERPRHWTLWDPVESTEQFSHPFHQSHQGKIFQEASVHLRKCLSLAGLDMTIKRRRGRNFGLSCLILSPLTRCSHYPLKTCARSHRISEAKDFELLSPFQEIQHFDGKKENNWKLRQAHTHAPKGNNYCSKSQTSDLQYSAL